MPDSELETSPGSDADPSPELATRGWEAPPGASQPTLVFPDLSTPGPDAPGRVTLAETTDNVPPVARRASNLPPIPGYEIERYVGRGGMGVVYRATHTATGRVVALKLTNPGAAGDEMARKRFVREVHALAAIKHPNIVPVYDAGEWHGFAYCTMEFVEGGALNQHLDRIRADLRAAVRLIAKVARAVEALHSLGIIHRDLKPLNILLGPNDEPMVADFGLAKWMDDDSDLTHTGLPVGTRQYMSPEQTLGKKQDYTAACDVWAMGVTLYELLTGHRPFSDDGVTDVYHSIRTTEPLPMTALSPAVPVTLQAVVSKCLAKKPEDRYPTAAALADDLDRWLDGKPVSVPLPAPAPPIATDRAKKPRRTRVLMTAGVVAALAIAVVVAIVVSTKPTPEVNAELPPTFAERVARGEKVKLTDDKGQPTAEPLPEPNHVPHQVAIDGLNAFTHNMVGIASLNSEPLTPPYRVEADIAVQYTNTQGVIGGIYVARRSWPHPDFKHESLVAFDVTPDLTIQPPIVPTAHCVANLYWWERNENGSTTALDTTSTPWSADGKVREWRFVPVVVDVRADDIKATMDGRQLKPIKGERFTGAEILSELDRKVARRKGFTGYTFTPPAFGSGLGVFCQKSTCVVRNLTVSKLSNP